MEDQNLMPSRAPHALRHLVDPAGLASLRLAVAMASDPMSGMASEGLRFRTVPSQRATHLTGVGRGGTALADAPTGVPTIPHPSSPTEPLHEQTEVLALVRAAQEGDGEAFGQLYDRYFDVVHRYIAFRVGDRSLAEDLTSETFLRALRRISSYTWLGRDFGAWLVTIARNLIADHFKSSTYKLELATSDLVEAGAERATAGPEDEVLAGITNASLLHAVKQLGAEQQECIVLRFLQGMTVAETAVILGKKEDAVKALQYRAVKALARLLPAERVA